MLTHSPMANIFIILAIALGVVVVVDGIILPIIQAYAAGGQCALTPGFNASKGRCYHP
jgi:hypothetical protein